MGMQKHSAYHSSIQMPMLESMATSSDDVNNNTSANESSSKMKQYQCNYVNTFCYTHVLMCVVIIIRYPGTDNSEHAIHNDL